MNMIEITPEHIGQRVIYVGPGLCHEIGNIVGFNEDKVFVRIDHYPDKPFALDREDLEWAATANSPLQTSLAPYSGPSPL